MIDMETVDKVIEGLKERGYQIMPRWQCGARQRNIGPEVQDCDWPVCGCNPYASKVLDAIAESGFEIVKKSP